MKRLFSLLCCLALMLCFSTTSVIAAERTKTYTNTDNAKMEVVPVNIEDVSMRATSKGLWYKENWWFIGTQSFNVTPESGANLNVWLKNDNPVTVTVYKTNVLGGYSKVYGSKVFQAGERDVRVATNCNGKKFLVRLESALDGSKISILVYQN